MPLVLGLPSGKQPQCNSPSISVNAGFPSGAPTSAWQCHTGDTMDRCPHRRNFLSFSWGWEWGWVPVALEHSQCYQGHQDSPCCDSALFLWRSLPFPEGGIAESEAVHPSRETFWRAPAGSPTPPQSNIVLPQKNLTGQGTAGLEQPLRSAELCIPLGLPGGSWTGFLLNQAQSMLKEGLF